MKKFFVVLILSIVNCQLSMAQIGSWRNYLAYHNVQQIQAAGNELFVMASNDLYQYNKKDQSIYTYDKTNGLSDTYITNIRWCKQAKRLVVIYQNSNIDLIETSGKVTNISDIYSKSITGGKTIYNAIINGVYAYLACEFGVVKLNVKDADISETYMLGFPVTAIAFEGNNIYVQSSNKGVWTANMQKNLIDPSNWTQTETYPSFADDLTDYNENIDIVKTLSPGGPKHNNFEFTKFYNGKLYATNGNNETGTAIQVLNNNEWTIFQDDGISDITGLSYPGAYCLEIDPSDEKHVFAGGRNGLYEFLNGKFVKLYNSDNSPFEPYNGKNKEYVLITGVKYDSSGNLWIMNSQAPTTSMVKFANNAFTKYNHAEIMKLNDAGFTNKSNGDLSELMIDSRGLMWFVNSNWYDPAIYCYDFASDKIIAYENFTNQDGTNYTYCYPYHVTEDLNGNMWIATNRGPFMIKSEDVGQNTNTLYQEKVPRNDGTNLADYLLAGLHINCIAVDGAGRKWFATNGTGVFLISADNMTQLQHFTTENSSILSDNINYISINNQTGEVFFATDKGLCSYISDATEAATEMDKETVWAYPNPVTPDYTGPITIVGLTLNADVKILAPNGALVYEGRSNGGTFTWNGCDKEGRRVSSGIYMVATATKDGNKGTVCKIAVVR